MGGWWRWALVSPDGVAPSRMVCVSASVNLPLRHKVRSSLLAPACPVGPRKRAVKRLWCGGDGMLCTNGCTDQHATWYGGRPRPRPRRLDGNPAPPPTHIPERGTAAPFRTFCLMSVVAKQSSTAATHELLFIF